ncbi:MAG: alkaline phosphatase [Acidobacteria bacterium]|nr:alkaline phosphatase [Acidobacteriota bacterium]
MRGQVAQPAANNRAVAIPPSVRIMPPDGSAFLVGQRFDIRAEAPPNSGGPLRISLDGRDISEWNNRSHLTGQPINHPPSPALSGAPAFLSRDWSFPRAGRHTLRATIEGAAPREVSFEIIAWQGSGTKVRNVILLIGDGLGVAQRTAARIVSRGLTEGRYRNGMLEMDQMQATGLVTTSSFSAMVTDSSPGASCYATGNKGANNEEGVFPDNTDNDALKRTDPESERFFDNPSVENISEYLRRTRGMNLGLVTTADVTDATPAAFAVHTSNRNASTRIADDYFDRRDQTGLAVLMGGGRQWFEPKAANGRQGGRRGTPTNEKVDPARDLVKAFRGAGFTFIDSAESLRAARASHPPRLLGLFAPSVMPVALDKLGHGAERVTNVPMLDDMARAAINSLSSSSPRGFFLMIEGASIDKQAHFEDADRAIWETIEFDRAVGVAKRFAEQTNSDADPNNDTLVIVTADHETGGFSLIGARNPDPRIPRGSRDAARAYRGFPDYRDADSDGYPDEVDPPSKLIVGFGAGTDHYEDWISNKRPLPPTIIKNGRALANPRRDGPEDAEPASRNGTLITGQVENGESAAIAADLDIDPMVSAVHTATDIPLTATGPGALQFVGVQDNTSVFFKMMRAYGGSFPRVYYDGPRN